MKNTKKNEKRMRKIRCHICDKCLFVTNKNILFVTYTIIQSIMRSEMCSLHLTHPSVHTWSSGQQTVQRPGSSRGLPARD